MADYTEAIEESFKYHPPHGDQAKRYEALRTAAKALAHGIDATVPNSREKLIALDRLAESIMWANRGIAVNEALAEGDAE